MEDLSTTVAEYLALIEASHEEVLADDGSILWNVHNPEAVDEIDKLNWDIVAAYFISKAQKKDPEGKYVCLENFDTDGNYHGLEIMKCAVHTSGHENVIIDVTQQERKVPEIPEYSQVRALI